MIKLLNCADYLYYNMALGLLPVNITWEWGKILGLLSWDIAGIRPIASEALIYWHEPGCHGDEWRDIRSEDGAVSAFPPASELFRAGRKTP